MYLFPSGNTDLFRGLKMAGVTGFGDEWLQIGAVKFCRRRLRVGTNDADVDPFKVGRTILESHHDRGEIDAAVEDAYRHGFRSASTRTATSPSPWCSCLRTPSEDRPRRSRPRIEHCSLVNPELLRRIKAIGAIPAPFYTYAHYHGEKWEAYGAEKMEWMFAHRSFLDYGITVVAASDYTPGPYEPMMALQSMVTRKDFEGRFGAESEISR
jgi:hypothetical protein